MSNCPLDTGQQDLKTNDGERFPLTNGGKKERVKVERERDETSFLVSYVKGRRMGKTAVLYASLYISLFCML